MRQLTLLEWQLIPHYLKGFAGNGVQTYIVVRGKRIEVEVVDEDGKRISHVGWPEEHFTE